MCQCGCDKYGGKVIAFSAVGDRQKIVADMIEAFEELVDQDNEVRVARVGDTYNVIQHKIPRTPYSPTVGRTQIYDPHRGVYPARRKPK